MEQITKAQWKSLIRETKLLDSEAKKKQQQDIQYLMEISAENLLLPYYIEAGMAGNLAGGVKNAHGGWDNPLSQIRGTFTGHWLSAAARLWDETRDVQLKTKADNIVSEIAKCQQKNGNGWAFSIPEKYLYGIRHGQHFWAPQYVCHKTMMGLLDMYLFAENDEALRILKGCADWFISFVENLTGEQMENMMDLEETGGMMELWADLYDTTGEKQYRRLMEFYERKRLTEPLLQGKDVLTNMHANTTIPEIHGCARAYEVTGEKRYLDIVKCYWDQAVTARGMFATGGQTDGEVWTAPGRQAARRSRRNQEHCVVYNMIRLADYLFRFTGEAKYLDYMELNRENGLFAQGFWSKRRPAQGDGYEPDIGLIAYYLPLAAGGKKTWGSRFGDFWCCHGTLVQANARYREYIFYQKADCVTVAQYQPAVVHMGWQGSEVKMTLQYENVTGETIKITENATAYGKRPDFLRMKMSIEAEKVVNGSIRFRIPWWSRGKIHIWRNGQKCEWEHEGEETGIGNAEEPETYGFARVDGAWKQDELVIEIPKGLYAWPLADEPDTVAFLDGPVLLAGLISEERMLYGNVKKPESMLAADHERQWEAWMPGYRTVCQPVNFRLKPIKEIGNEIYTVYFPVKHQDETEGRCGVEMQGDG